MRDPNVTRIVGDQCAYGHIRYDMEGIGYVKKPTGWMSNGLEILKALGKRCPNGNSKTWHRHVPTMGGRITNAAKVYPEGICKAIVQGFRKQMIQDGRMMEGGIGIMDKVDEGEQTMWEWATDRDIIDDMSGEVLDKELIREARKEEINECRKHRVWKKVPVEKCWELTGKAPIKTKWVYVNKGDKIHPVYRARFVAMEFNRGKRDEFCHPC